MRKALRELSVLVQQVTKASQVAFMGKELEVKANKRQAFCLKARVILEAIQRFTGSLLR